ncbi:MAG: hypothetical protein PQJ59_05075 [Spirochaetales bacterium]|nr:hypothetical protein [Spirochaetales bacterium]
MNNSMKKISMVFLLLIAAATIYAGGAKEANETTANEAPAAMTSIDDVAAALGVTTQELTGALGKPSLGAPNFAEAAEKLDVDAEKLEKLMMQLMGGEDSVELDPYIVTLNGVDFELTYKMFSWDELPADVEYERQPIQEFTIPEGDVRWYEVVYVSTGNLNWYQAAYLAQDAGGYLACMTSEEENSFVFELVNDRKYFSFFDENGQHYGIGIGPFLGGYQPEGSVEPAGGWTWLSGEAWEYTNWAQNLDDGVIDKDPRDNTQPNNSADGQPIMGFGELNVPVPTWGDYTDSVGTYGTRGPTKRYGFIIEYESDPTAN